MDQTIQNTTRYDMFQSHAGNRPLNEQHIKDLMKSIGEHNMLEYFPLLVTNNYQILDGQHRLEAAKRLGVPVYFRLADMTIADVQLVNNNSRRWKLQDYMLFYVAQGNRHYQEFADTWNDIQIAFGTLIPAMMWPRGEYRSGVVNQSMMYNIRGSGLKKFRKGEFTVGNKDYGTFVGMIKDLEPYYPGWRRRDTGLAMLYLYHLESYDHQRMMEKIQMQSTRLVPCVSSRDMVELLESVYNYKAQDRVRFL